MHAALALDPKALILQTNLGWIHYTARRYPLAIAEMQQVVAQNPDFLSAHYKLWWTYSVMGDEPHAWQEFQIVVRTISSPEQTARILAAYTTGGYAASLRALYNADDQNYYGDNIDAARCMMFSGDSKGAMTALNQGLARHDGWMIFAPTDPAFTSLHADPQYIRFVSQLNSKSAQPAK
jgi:tetratricopeptide (TPR) repeat protein